MFVHGVLGMFEESLLTFRGRAVVVLLVGALGMGGGAGFLPGQFFLGPAVREFGCSTQVVRGPSRRGKGYSLSTGPRQLSLHCNGRLSEASR